MKEPTRTSALIIMLALMSIICSPSPFILTVNGKSGKQLISTVCNIQTTIDFYFSPSTTLTGPGQTLVIIVVFRLMLVLQP